MKMYRKPFSNSGKFSSSQNGTPRTSRLNCLRSMKTLNLSIDSSLAEEGISKKTFNINRKTVKRSLEKYFGFTLAHLTSLLVEFIHQQASIGTRAKHLTPYKDLLCVANEGNVSRYILFNLVKKIKHGALGRKWNIVLSTDLLNDAARYSQALKHGIPSDLIISPYFNMNKIIPLSTDTSVSELETLDVDQPSIIFDKMVRNRVPQVIIYDKFGNTIEHPYLSNRKTQMTHKLNKSYDPRFFVNPITSTRENDFNRQIDGSWRRKMMSPKIPKNVYFYHPSNIELPHIPILPPSERYEVHTKNLTPRQKHKQRMKDLIKEIQKIDINDRPKYRSLINY